MPIWTNQDGLEVRFGLDRTTNSRTGTGREAPMYFTLTVDVEDGFPTGPADGDEAFLPAGAYITKAFLVVQEAFAGGTSVDVGLVQPDGTSIDADGLAAGVTTAEMQAGEAVDFTGVFVGGTAALTQRAAVVIAPTGTFTAGKAKIFIEYVK